MWAYKGNTHERGNNRVAPIAFYKATNYEANFYALSDIAMVDQMTNNIDYSGDAWPCENQKEANQEGKNKAFTHLDMINLQKVVWPKDTDDYEYQDGNLKCGKGQKLRILTAEFGRPWNKPICWSKFFYAPDPPSAAGHKHSWLWPNCDSTDLYPYLKDGVLHR